MKILRNYICLSSIYCLLLFPSLLLSIEIQGYSIKTKTISEDRIDVTVELKDYTITEFMDEGRNFSKLEMRGAVMTAEPGKPELPSVPILFGIPVTGSFKTVLSNINTERKTVRLINPVKSILLGREKKSSYTLDECYSKDAYYPGVLNISKEVGFFRDHRIGSILFYPFRYNPKKQSLLIVKKVTFSIHFLKQDNKNGVIRFPRKNSPEERLFSELVVNYSTCRLWLKPHPLPEPLKLRQAGSFYKIITKDEGLYQITYDDLVNSGIDPLSINARDIHITYKGYEIPIYVKGEEDSIFNNQDYIDFFAEKIKGEYTYFNPYTDENIYWLSFGDSLGKRMVDEDGTPYDTIPSLLLHSSQDTLHFEKDSISIRLSNPSADSSDIWFWDRLYGPDSQTIHIYIPFPDTVNVCNLSIMLHGLTTTSYGHRVQVSLNDSFLGEFSFSGQTPYRINIEEIPGNLLLNGDNTITLFLPAPVDSVDGLFSNWIEISYTHLFDAVDNRIKFKMPYETIDTTYKIIIGNFDFADIDIYKKNVSRIINIKKETYQSGGQTKYRFIFHDNDITGLLSFSAIPIWDKLKPVSIEKIETRDLHSPGNRAEYLIITNQKLLNSAEQFGLWKETQGFNCMVVTVDEIYNEFNYGIASPEAIKTFITYAYDYYMEPPVFCLLFGDGSYDYKGISGHNGNIVPVHLSWYWNVWGHVADDEYYVRVSGDDFLPDIFIGRFPIRTNEEFDALFEKLKIYVDYQNLDEWKKDLVFVADSVIGYNSYPNMESIILNYLPPAFDASRCYHPRKNREDFLKEMDEGAVFLNFLSHGGGDILCGGDFLVSEDIYRMTNLDRVPFWTAFSCNNGFFDEPPDSHSIGETVFLAPNGGGIGYYGPGSNTYGHYNHPISANIYDGIFNKDLRFIGQILSYGEIKYFSTYGNKYPLMTYNLLGDPGIELALPDSTKIDILLSPASLSTGDTLSVQGNVFGSPSGEAIVTFHSIRDIAITPFSKISVPVSAGNFFASTILPDTLPPSKGIVKVYFRGANKNDGVGFEYFNVEQPNISAVTTIPEVPTVDDSVQVQARIFDPDSIINADMIWRFEGASTWNNIRMIPYSADTFITTSFIPPQSPNTTIEFRIFATDSFGNTDTSRTYSYHITARAELSFFSKNIYLGGDSIVEINVEIQNTGETPADSFRVGFYTLTIPEKNLTKNDKVKIPISAERDTISYDTLSLGVDSIKTATASFNLPFDRYDCYAVIDPDNWIEEEDESNNSSIDSTTSIWVDHFAITPDSGTGGSVQSCDSILYCTFPPNVVSSKTVLILKPDSSKKPILEPDISPVPINGDTSTAYSIILSKAVLKDSFLLSFTLKDSITSTPWVYLWLDDYRKWTTIGKLINDSIFYEIWSKNYGLLSLFFNNDSIPPNITSRIENLDYKNGTVYEKNVRISAVMTDNNGIDVVTRNVNLVLNGDSVESSNYTYSKNPSDTRALPLKYSQELEDGQYNLIISAYDVNGNQGFDTLSFNISIPFDINGIGNYPNPVYLDSTIFTYRLTRNSDEVVLKIFSSGGRLIKEFVNNNVSEGYHEITWKLKDKKRIPVANGVYFYRFIARRRGEEKVKTYKMAILR
ncbi:hypothetical protein KAU34_00380 [candidate division WOR-3 bacterium]|nr:hypothetical protein [candidate division WOR-3 bacterium]